MRDLWEREFWVCYWTLCLGEGKENWGARVHFGAKKVLGRRELRVESSKEEGKGYSLWELRASAWECPQAPKKWGKAAPKAQIWREMRGLERWELGENGTLWPQPV